MRDLMRMKISNAKVLWITGLSAAGKTTLAKALQFKFNELGIAAQSLDGDELRATISSDLGYSREDRRENIRRAAALCKFYNDQGITAIASFISPYQEDRTLVKNIVGIESYFEIYINTPLSICERRDPKGLYKKARSGELKFFTGISDHYEIPQSPNIVIDTTRQTIEDSVSVVLDGIISQDRL